MNRITRITIAAALALACLPASIAGAEPPAPTVPPDIEVPDGNKLYLVGHAIGAQIYTCNLTAGGGYRWSFAGPRADVYGQNGKLITTHYAGPRWQATDGSIALGSNAKPVTVDPTAIPWLRLNASGSAGPNGDRLASTTFIQRLNTTGGLIPPAEDCNADTIGSLKEVPYTADYTFWKAVRD
jgi:uncharacterized protein DUF3455